MLKRLRIQFVCIVMTIVTAMLCTILGLVIHFTGLALETQSMQMMQTIAANPFQLGKPDQNNRTEYAQLPFFAVQISRRGELIATGGGYYDLSDTKTLLKIVQTVLSSEEQSGVLQEYSLRFSKTVTPSGHQIVFADMSSERATMANLIRNCVLVGICSTMVFLAISILLARWMVKPVDQAWQQQKQFIADASHELKTPLTVIMTNAELLQYPQYSEAERRQFSDSILTMSRQMRGLVEGLLELARVDNGAVKTSYAELDLSSLITEDILPFEPLFFEKGLTLSTAIEKGIRIKGSASHLRQVLDILLDNAMKYSAPNGQVWVKLIRHNSHCVLSVASPGDGISQEDLKNIFKRFYRADKARSRDGSYGLGLSIAQSIVLKHHGKIWAESQSGVNTFFIQLPIQSYG